MSSRLAILTALISAASAWGPDGHSIAAQIADDRISSDSRKAVNSILGTGASLANYSSWADDIKYGSDGYKWKWSSGLHFADVPDCSFNYARDCKNDKCVAGGILNYTSRMVDESLPLSERQNALKFVIHFVGDAHQPLHVGRPSDRGGNNIKVDMDFAQYDYTNLHSVWDSKLLFELQGRLAKQQHGGKRVPYWMLTEQVISKNLESGGEYYGDEDSWIAECKKSGLSKCVDQWVDESAEAACDSAYKHVNGTEVHSGDELPMGYYNDRIDVVEEQLAKAGIRLAWVLDNSFSTASVVTPTAEPASYALPLSGPSFVTLLVIAFFTFRT